jgi:hypothetical protein
MIKPFPVVTLESSQASDRFAQWARRFGIFRLGRSLEVDFSAVRKWLRADSRPTISKAKEIIALSSIEPLDGEPLTYEDIYGTARAATVETRHVKKVRAWE